MLRGFLHLLGEDAPLLRRYGWMALAHGLLNGFAVAALVPVLQRLLAGDASGAAIWLAAPLAGVTSCWAWRRQVEKAGIAVGVAILRGGRHRIGDHVARLPVGWFTPENTARLSHVVTHGMMTLAQLPAHVFTPVIGGAVAPLVIVAALLALDWPMGLIALLALPVIAAGFLVAARLARRADAAFQRDFAETSRRIVEFAQAQSVLRAFNGAGTGSRRLEQAIARQQNAGAALIRLSTLSVVLTGCVIQAGFAALLVAALFGLAALPQRGGDAGSVIALVLALLLACRFSDALLEVAGYGEALRGARNQLDEVRAIFAVQPLPEPDRPQTARDASVAFCGAHFRYGPDQPDVLQDVTLCCEPGSMTALVGASGSGKTTLLRLIARFFDVSAGSVRIGGVDVREMSGEHLAATISQIFQDIYLFEGSIADNIRIGKPDAGEEEVLEAARQAGVLAIVSRLPEGLDSAVGEGGARLSGGERQRISIARALIKPAPILLIDEATAALDAENQAAIARTLARLRGERTLIVIAHQLSTVSMADRIVVLDGGRIVEQGTHEQLSAGQGRYAEFLAQRRAAQGWRIAGSDSA